jgi:hypothetical protein
VIIDLQLLIDAVAVFDDESAVFLSIVEDLDSAVDRSYFLTQEMPAKMRLTGWLPAGTLTTIQGDFHFDLLSGLVGNLVLIQKKLFKKTN